jgi:GAF domain-containing protein
MRNIEQAGGDIIRRSRTLQDTLEALCKLAEQQRPGSIAGVALVDGTGLYLERAYFPSLSDDFQNAIAFVPLAMPYTGTCAEAICRGIAVSSTDITNDSRFEPNWRSLCLRHGLQSIKSVPVTRQDGTVLGTFVVGFREPVSSDDYWDKDLMATFAGLVARALDCQPIIPTLPSAAGLALQ